MVVQYYQVKAVKIPATIGKDDVLIKTDAIQNDQPLLPSKDSMKRGNVNQLCKW